MEPVDIWIRRQKWRWIGHILHKDNNYIAKKAMEWNPVSTYEKKSDVVTTETSKESTESF